MKRLMVVSMLLFFFSFFQASIFAQTVTTAPTETPTVTITTTPTTAPAATITPTPTPDTKSQKSAELQDKIAEYEGKVSVLQKEGQTLSSQIAVIDNQIKLTEYRMNATQGEINELTGDITIAEKKIDTLETSLEDITRVLLNRVVTTYQIGSIEPMQVLLTSDTVSNFLSRANYLRLAQDHDKKLLYQTQQARSDYQNQKSIFEAKKQKVVALKVQLIAYTEEVSQQKLAKENLLSETKNDEKKYQQLLAAARSEYESIQGIVAGNGTEVLIGDVTQGQRIATVISGASCNSGGTHLHFIVRKNGTTENPFSYLKSGIEYANCSGGGACSEGDPFNPSGSWEWPINPKITMAQGYGSTWAARNTWVGRIYSFHNGLDISSSSLEVKAVKDGQLYRGSYAGSGCRLPYVRVKHKDDGIDTLYLHVY